MRFLPALALVVAVAAFVGAPSHAQEFMVPPMDSQSLTEATMEPVTDGPAYAPAKQQAKKAAVKKAAKNKASAHKPLKAHAAKHKVAKKQTKKPVQKAMKKQVKHGPSDGVRISQ